MFTSKGATMKKIFFFIAFLFFFISSLNPAYSATLIDTGEPPYSEIPMGLSIYRRQTQDDVEFNWLAGKISLAEEWGINSIKTFFDNNRPQHYPAPNPGSLVDITVILYGNVENDFGGGIIADIPDLNSVFFNDTFGIPTNWQYGWFGIENCNFNLLSGDYWVAFEIHDPTIIETVMPFPPNSLESYARTIGNNPVYYPSSLEEGFALRIEGDVVPEPISICLFTFGAFLLKFFNKRR